VDHHATLLPLSRHARILTLRAIHAARSGHPGGALSAVDLLVWLYHRELSLRQGEPRWPERDRFVLSKGHAAPALYAVLAACGLIEEAELAGFRRLGSPLQGHPHSGALAWVEQSTGSLGQGFAAALGIALGLKHQHNPARSYVLLGDGELQEGMIWEAALCAAHYRLDNLCAILDYNRLQSDAPVQDILALEPLRAKWEAFNWQVVECDGHDFEAIAAAFGSARATRGAPSLIIAHTVKGKGVSFMENSPAWHGSLTLRDEELARALAELEGSA
jgi:transketolase